MEQFSSVQSLSYVWLFAIPWTSASQTSLSITNSQSPPKPMSIESAMPSNHLILCHPLLLLPSIFPRIRVFSNESAQTELIGCPWWLRQKSICLQCGRPGFDPWVRKIPWRRKWQSTPVLLPGKSHGQRSLVGYSPWGWKELDTTEWFHFHFSR